MNDETMEQRGLVKAFILDGEGGGTAISWPEIEGWRPGDGKFLWLHLDYSHPYVQRWLKNRKGLDYLVVENLLAEDSRPRSTPFHDGLLMGLRGVNLNPGAVPEDMVAIRLWIDGQAVFSTGQRFLPSIDDMGAAIESGAGPAAPGEFLAQMCEFVMNRVGDVVEDFETIFDGLEEEMMKEKGSSQRQLLSNLRRQIIELRKYLAPQRDALGYIQGLKITWLQDADKLRLREVGDRLFRYVEELDSIRDRSVVLHEELVSQLSEEMNKRMYMLSLVATIFMPLGFLAGLLGVNLGGIPGASSWWGFSLFCLLLLAVFAMQLLYLKNKKWM
jgi:zinc transporter